MRSAVYVDGGQDAEGSYPSSVVADVDGRRWSYLARVEPGADGLSARRPGELYALDTDPTQQRNLVAAEPRLAERLERMLVARLRNADALSRRLAGARESVELSPEDRHHLHELGYGDLRR